MKKTLLIGAAAVALVAGGAALAHGPYKGGGHHQRGYHHGHYDGDREWGRGGRDMRGHRAARRFARRFDEIDADGDGLVTREEIAEARARRFAEMDANADGSVDAAELVAHRMQKRAERRIQRLDENGDGVLQESEMPDGSRLLNRFDLNADGAVSRAEMRLARQHMRGGHRGGRHHWGRGGDGRGWGRGERSPGADGAPQE